MPRGRVGNKYGYGRIKCRTCRILGDPCRGAWRQPARQGRDTRIALRERKRDDGFIVGDAVAQYTQVAQVPRDHTALYAFGLQIGRAHVRTHVTNATLGCSLLLEKNKTNKVTRTRALTNAHTTSKN